MPMRTRRGAAEAEPEAEAETRHDGQEAVVSGDVDDGGEDEGENESEEGEEGEEDEEGDGESEEDVDVEGERLSDEDDEVDSSDEDGAEIVEGEEGEEAAEDDSDAEEVRKSATALSIAGPAASNGTAADAESDSEDEMPLNTIGNVPLEWYDDFDHVGYDLEGNKIMRSARQDELDALIQRFDDPDASRTIHDALHGVDVVLSKDDVALIKRLQRRKYPGANFDPYPETVPFDYPDGKIHPLSNAPPRKAPFLPSKDEAKTVMRLVMAMRSEQYQKSVANRRAQDAKERPDYQYLIWDDPSEEEVKHHKRLPAPKLALPGNAESYNPPKEYLFTPEEREAWEKMDPSDRPINFIPQAFSAMRRVPQYEPLIRERFERCLDLYLCPREAKTKLDIDPDSLIPQLPSPAELRPFPERLSNRFLGHAGRVYSISVSPSGEWLLSAAADGTVKLWEVASTRCERTFQLGGEVRSVRWCPNGDTAIAAAVVGARMVLLCPLRRPLPAAERAAVLLEPGGETANSETAAGSVDAPSGGVAWTRPDLAARDEGVCWEVTHVKSASSVCWHHKGDYLASVAPEGASRAVLLHQISKRKSGSPFAKSKGRVEAVAFHPKKPWLLVATQRHVRIYDLASQELHKKLNPAVKWISSIDVHPGGDHLILGSYDKKLCWFDLDLSASPYKTLRSHSLAVRAVAYHSKLPLFASSSDDASVHVYHGRVYSDLLTNALIVPVKILKGHHISSHLGVMDIAWHPTQPWLFSAGADGNILLHTG